MDFPSLQDPRGLLRHAGAVAALARCLPAVRRCVEAVMAVKEDR